MQRKKFDSSEGYSLRTFFLFCLFVSIAIVISLCIKFIVVVRESVYDGHHRFTVVANEAGDKATIYSIDKDANSVSILHISNYDHKTPLSKVLGIVTDATIPTADYLTHARVIRVFFLHGNKDMRVTGYDLLRLNAFLHVIQPGSIQEKSLVLSSHMDVRDTQNLVQQLFTDDVIAKENASIQIINATDETGLGTRLERVLTDAGGSVISINTADKESEQSHVAYSGDLTYTVKKVASFLGVTPEKKEVKSLSDIIITIGRDQLPRNVF